eukprot:3190632-Rhodomonas_salina.3
MRLRIASRFLSRSASSAFFTAAASIPKLFLGTQARALAACTNLLTYPVQPSVDWTGSTVPAQLSKFRQFSAEGWKLEWQLHMYPPKAVGGTFSV